MALTIMDATTLALEEALRLRGMIDLARPGAIEALQKAGAKASVAALRDLVSQFPIVAPERFVAKDVTSKRAAAAQAILAAKINKRDSLAFRAGSDGIGCDDLVRHSTGSLVLNWMLDGDGFPAGAACQLKGPDASGKTFTAQKTAEAAIWAGKRVLWVAVEQFNATWARRCGIPILIDVAELKKLGYPEQMIEDALRYNEQVEEPASRFCYTVGRSGDGLLQSMCEAIQANLYDVVVMDSIAAARRDSHITEAEVGKEYRGGEAKLIGDFCSRAFAAFNEVEAAAGKQIGKDEFGPIIGERPRSTILLLNQLRDQGLDGMFKMRPDSPGGRGLKHAKSIDLEFLRSEDVQSDDPNMPGRVVTVARRTLVNVAKSKVCDPNRKGVIEMQLADHPCGTRAGRWGVVTDLFGAKVKSEQEPGSLAEAAGVVSRSGAWWEISGGARFHGRPKLEAFLNDPANAHVVSALYTEVQAFINAGSGR